MPPIECLPPLPRTSALVLTLVLGACATLPPGAGAPTAAAQAKPAPAAGATPVAAAPSPSPSSAPKPVAAASGAAPAAAAPPAPGASPPFASVVKDAKKVAEGLLTVWQKDEKVWLELKPEDFERAFVLSPRIAQGIGEAGLYGGMTVFRGGGLGRANLVQFRRVHNQVQLVALNRRVRADAGTPEARAVERGFSDSLVASTAVASAAHPERKTVLVDATPLFMGDVLGVGATLQQTYRQNYGLDPRHTAITAVRATADELAVNVRAHFATAALAAPPPVLAPGAPLPSVPSTLPDARSMFVGLQYSIARLPEQPMAPRVADPRVGHFTTNIEDFASDAAPSPRRRFVDRWRLQKKDPTAALSEPVKPIVFWIDRTVPLRYRDAVTHGILEWNKAFEKIGFKDAVQVQVQPDDAPYDTLDIARASVRWVTTARAGFDGYGPSIADPRSGEILDADIVLDAGAARAMRVIRGQVLGDGETLDFPALMQIGSEERLARLLANRHLHPAGEACEYGSHAAEQLGYAVEVLAARGEIDPDDPVTEQFAAERVKAVTVHEVGHALGLRHNFRSSRAYTLAQLADPAFTAEHGITASVMDYPDLNLPPPGVPLSRHGAVFRSALGPYDYWAIEYAYKPIDAKDEAAELQRIAARSPAPELAYGTDEDNALGIDPESLTFDLGDDPLAYARLRYSIAHDLIRRQETRQLRGDRNYSPLRRALRFAVRDAAIASGVLARQIGGVRTLRDFPGSGRDPIAPVPGAVQREALDMLVKNVFASESFRLSPALQRKLAPDFDDRNENPAVMPTEFSIDAMVLEMQRTLLNQLMGDAVASRLLDSAGKTPNAQESFRLSELYTRLDGEIWSELRGRGDIAPARRELQREHAARLAAVLLRPSAGARADQRSLVRAEARALLDRLRAARKRAGLSAEARAHLDDTAETLTQALAARLQRAGA